MKIYETRTSIGRKRLAEVLLAVKSGIVTVADTVQALKMSRIEAAKQLARWSKQGKLKRLRRGVYLHVPEHAANFEMVLPDAWTVVPELFGPAYIGGWTAASHWNFTEQITRTVFVFTQRRPRHRRVDVTGTLFYLRHINKRLFFGLKPSWQGSVKVEVSDPARTLVDMLNAPKIGGGIAHVAHCFRSFLIDHEQDVPKLIEYADRLGNGAVFKRLGLLSDISDRSDLIEQASQHMTSGISELDPPNRGSKIVTRWRLRVPMNWQRVLSDD